MIGRFHCRKKRVSLWNLGLLLAIGTMLFHARPASSYLAQLQVPPTASNPGIHWDNSAFPIVWSPNPQTGSNISGDRDAVAVISLAFHTWTSAPNASLSATQGDSTSVSSPGNDGINLICFTCSTDFNKDTTTLAVTVTTSADAAMVGQKDKNGRQIKFAGQILDADILFNPAVTYSTNNGGPESGASDLQTVATHEIGHFFGLDHSAVARAIMFPYSPGMERTLSYDDVAGIAMLYPKGVPDMPTGRISGKVSMADGSPIFGAHVFANSTTGADPFAAFNSPKVTIRKTPVGTLTLPDGTYTIRGLPPDAYVVAAEPLDQPVQNNDVSDYAPTFQGNGATLQTNFTTRWH